jgi:hypothetical protein
VGTASATFLYIPFSAMLLSVYNCSHEAHPLGDAHPDFWLDAGYVCYEGAHLGLLVISTVLTAVLFLLALVFTAVFIDSHPLSPNIGCKSTGRVDIILLVAKTALVVVGDVSLSKMGHNGAWVLAATNLACALVWLWSTLHMMPYYHDAMNIYSSASAAIYAFTAVCYLLQVGLAEAVGFDAAVMWYTCVPLAAAVGALLHQRRRQWIVNVKKVTDLKSPFDFELRVRLMLQAAIADALTDSSSAPSHRTAAAVAAAAAAGEPSKISSLRAKFAAAQHATTAAGHADHVPVKDVGGGYEEPAGQPSRAGKPAAPAAPVASLLHAGSELPVDANAQQQAATSPLFRSLHSDLLSSRLIGVSVDDREVLLRDRLPKYVIELAEDVSGDRWRRRCCWLGCGDGGAEGAGCARLDSSFFSLTISLTPATTRPRTPELPRFFYPQTFRLAVMRLPDSSLVQALQARFYGVFKGDPKLMLSHFMQVRGGASGGDVRRRGRKR